MSNRDDNAYVRHAKFLKHFASSYSRKTLQYERLLMAARSQNAPPALVSSVNGPGGRFNRLIYAIRKMIGNGPDLGKRPHAGMPDKQLLEASGLFDADWYYKAYPDIAAKNKNAIDHFLVFGFSEDRDPGPFFSTSNYNEMYPDIRGHGLNPVIHYLRNGAFEGRTKVPSNLNAHGLVEKFLAQSRELRRAAPHVVYISGEPGTPGETYRVKRYADAWTAIGATVENVEIASLGTFLANPGIVDILILWRVAMIPELAKFIDHLKTNDVPVVFDVDDLMIEPSLVRTEVIDGLRSQKIPVSSARSHFERVRESFRSASIATASTDELVWFMRARGGDAFFLRNGFDDKTYETSRAAVESRNQAVPDGLLRIGYPGGSLTHQKDFAVCASAVCRILAENQNARLVLFKSRGQNENLVDVSEFPLLLKYSSQIEWRDKVALSDLPSEIARFDVCIAPLEAGNVYCEAKSELKYFEAAICDVCLVSSPVGPFAKAIVDGLNGFHANSEQEWYQKLGSALFDRSLRSKIVSRAHRDALARYGIESRIAGVRLLRDRLLGEPADQAASFLRYMPDLEAGPVAQCDIAGHRVITSMVCPGLAPEASVVIPLYNYQDYIREALDSVLAQTLRGVELIIVDDCSTDSSLQVARSWVEQNASVVKNVKIVQTLKNGGLANARNVGFLIARAPFVLPLDADNKLKAECLERLVNFAKNNVEAAFVYSTIEKFQGGRGTISNSPFSPTRLLGGNYIDAMALIRKGWWARVGGYDHIQFGWEDFDFWLKIVKGGGFGVHLDEVHSSYRVHRESMLQADTNDKQKKGGVVQNLSERYKWVSLVEGRDWGRHI